MQIGGKDIENLIVNMVLEKHFNFFSKSKKTPYLTHNIFFQCFWHAL